MPKTAIDINCDMGESFGAYKIGRDDLALQSISSANIACGFHAGDPHVMRRTVDDALARGVRVGAHPGLPDLLGFGRRRMGATPEQVRDFFTYQVGALRAFVHAAGGRLQHVKPHGAVFDMAAADPLFALAMCQATYAIDPGLIWLSPSGHTTAQARQVGLRAAQEFYADRAYLPDKRLVPRSTAGAVVHDLKQVRARLCQVLESGTVATLDGQSLTLEFESICVHSDTDGAHEILALVREVCSTQGVAIKPLGELFDNPAARVHR